MDRVRLALYLALGCLVVSCFGRVEAYYDNSHFELERSRNSLLTRRDDLEKQYQRLLQQSDDLNRQLSFVQQRIRFVYDDMKRTDTSLTDVEYSLKRSTY